MPTGFTTPIYDGEDITFEQFANSCLRNFYLFMPEAVKHLFDFHTLLFH